MIQTCSGDPTQLVLGLGTDHGVILHWFRSTAIYRGPINSNKDSWALGLGLRCNTINVEVIQTCSGDPNHLVLGLGLGHCVILH